MTNPDRCNNISGNYESFKILRSTPYINHSDKTKSYVWFAIVDKEPGKVHDPNNYISWHSTINNHRELPEDLLPCLDDERGNKKIIVDSTRIVVNNLINQKFIDVEQLVAYHVFGGDSDNGNKINICTPVDNRRICCIPDGVLQFIAIISIAPTCTPWLGGGLAITISPLTTHCLYSGSTYGNWCPFSFSIGNCNTQSATASLIYLTCPKRFDPLPKIGPIGPVIPDPPFDPIVCEGYVYDANYANVRFTLLNKSKCPTGGAKKACYLGIDSLDKACFLAFFAQQRNIANQVILLISPIVELKCIVWQPVFIITTNTPLSLTCAVPY
jgi:hypothetical protein